MFICKHGQSNTVEKAFDSKALRSCVYALEANDAQAIGRLAEFNEYVSSPSWPEPLAVVVGKDGKRSTHKFALGLREEDLAPFKKP